MEFKELVIVFEELELTTLRNEMMTKLASLIGKASKDEVKELVYLLMGTLRPKFDRLEFGLADKMVVRAIARAAKEPVEKVMALYKASGDLGETARQIHTEAETKGAMEVIGVYGQLEKIAKQTGQGSQDRKIDGLAILLGSMSGTEAKYAVRIVLGKLRLGFSDKTVLDALSYLESGTKEGREALDAAYQLAPDVGELAELVKEMGAEKSRKAVKIVLGRPMMPALAQRLRTADEMVAKMGQVGVEPKYDGTRVQIHYSRTRQTANETQIQNGLFATEKRQVWVKTFTRNLDENTAMFPELQRISSQINADEVILDSEAVGYDPDTGAMVPFQLTITRKRKHGVESATSTVPLRFYVFDILYKNGESLIDEPWKERRRILEETIKTTGMNSALIVDEAIVTGDPQTLRKYHKEQLAKGLEGALVKKVEGKYLPGRQDWNWVKFKEEEGQTGKLSDTVDGVIMGYYVGKGKRHKFGLGAFLLGIRGEGEKIVTVAKIGTGLTDEQFEELYQRLKQAESAEADPRYVIEKMLEPDVWVKPEIVAEVAADEITKSPVHSSGYALRFPRLVRVRDDKTQNEATSVAELKEIAGI